MIELLSRVRAGDAGARERAVEINLNLVHSLVNRFAGLGYDRQDLFQVGCLGLIKAIDRFDPAHGVQFSTYAVPLILGEIRRYLRDDGPVKVSRGLRELGLAAKKAAARLTQILGREPSAAEVAEDLGVEVARLVEAMDSLRTPASIDADLGSDGDDPVTLLDRLASEAGRESPLLEKMALRQALQSITSRDREIILRRFWGGESQTEVATILGVSQVQVSRLERKALARIKQLLNG